MMEMLQQLVANNMLMMIPPWTRESAMGRRLYSQLESDVCVPYFILLHIGPIHWKIEMFPINSIHSLQYTYHFLEHNIDVESVTSYDWIDRFPCIKAKNNSALEVCQFKPTL